MQFTINPKCIATSAEIVMIETVPVSWDGGISTKTIVYVDYIYNGNKYEEIPLSSSNSTMSVGKEIEIFVDKDNNHLIKHKTSSSLITFGVFGLIFILIGLLVLPKNSEKNPIYKLLHNPIYAFKVTWNYYDCYRIRIRDTKFALSRKFIV